MEFNSSSCTVELEIDDEVVFTIDLSKLKEVGYYKVLGSKVFRKIIFFCLQAILEN